MAKAMFLSLSLYPTLSGALLSSVNQQQLGVNNESSQRSRGVKWNELPSGLSRDKAKHNDSPTNPLVRS